MQTLTITAPDDWHIHLRDNDALKTTVPHAAASFKRAIVMPNLTPSVKNLAAAKAYHERIIAQIPNHCSSFTPLMTLYLTQDTSIATINEAKASGMIYGVKLYPAGATTNSNEGVSSIEALYPIFAAMEACDLPLLIHGEVIDSDIDVFDREATFIERHLVKLHQNFPSLRIVLEHISTEEAAEFILNSKNALAATITPQHLLYNRNAILLGGIKPHYYCLPILKREKHRQALLSAITSGSNKFFIGTDSAPHAQSKKEAACGCAGCYSATTAISLYAEAFESQNALDKLEAFLSFNGADFYGLPRNTETITLTKNPWQVTDHYPYLENDRLIPLGASEWCSWSIKHNY